MSNIPLPDNAGRVDTFTRQEGEDTVHMQATVPVDPATGNPLDLATEATLTALTSAVATLNAAAAAIQSAVEAINGKTAAVDTGNVAVASLPATVAQDATVQAIGMLNDTMLTVLAEIFKKMPRITGNDQAAVTVESGGITSTATLGTVTTIGTINAIGGKQAIGDNLNLAGVQHLYNNIIVN